MLKAMNDEIDRTQADLTSIETFAPNFHQAVRDTAEQARTRNEQELSTFLSTVETVKKLRTAIEDRMSEAEERRKVIRRVLDKYFRE